MRVYFLILFFAPFLALSQDRDYKNFDKAVKFNQEGNFKKSLKFAHKAFENSKSWEKPSLLLASIYANNNQIELAASYLLKIYMSDTILNLKGIKQIAKLYYVNGYYKEALSFCNILVEQDSIKYLLSSEIIKLINNSTFAIDAIENPSDFSPSNLGSNINSENEEYLPAISYDGKNLVFSRRFVKEGLLQEDFFISKKDENNIWGLSKPYVGSLNTNGNEGAFSFSSNNNFIVFTACDRYDSMGSCDIYLLIDGNIFNAGNVINSKDWDSQACFSPNGNYLYFVSSRQDGYGGKDIWRSKVTKNGFLKAENLGPEINTKDDEMSPFLHPDNLTFYFSSNGHIGMGDYDIFICKRFNTLENWKSPKNLGFPINTHKTENSLIVENDGITAYYTSNKAGFGLEDIFSFDLPVNLQANKISEIELEIISSERGEEIVLNNVIFAKNSSKIDSISFIQLDLLALYIIKNPQFNIEIQGHTDDIGSEVDNQILSENRAKVVYDYLSNKLKQEGIFKNNKLTFKGYGESNPIASNSSEKGRKLNRRTSFIVN